MQSEEQQSADDVCAVVVTYNRKALLRECLHALLAQTQPSLSIFIINNVSTDGTLEMLASEFAPSHFPQVEVTTLATNVGGAGGFHEGIKLAATRATWLWVMDDDTIPEPSALADLLAARARFPAEAQPDLLASRVIWSDGSMHPMNIPRLKRNDSLASMCLAAGSGTISIRSSSFVSLLIKSDLVQRYGLPVADYFIWNDDVEYTARILRREFGVLVPQSVVVHKTTQKVSEPGWKFYYGLRNSLWMTRCSEAWSAREKVERLVSAAQQTLEFLTRNFEFKKVGIVLRGLWHGLTKRPTS